MGLSLFSGVWILEANMHVDVSKKGFDIHFSFCVLLMIVQMSKVYRFRTWWRNTDQVGKQYPHLFYGI